MADVRAVEDRRRLADFLRTPWRVYEGDRNWVPPLLLERRKHLSARNPYFQHARSRFFVAYDGSTPVGRISAQLDSLAQHDGASTTGHFGFLEAVDAASLGGLLDAAEAWLRDQGAHRVEGPYSLSINDEAGLLVAGFDRPPRLLMNYAPAWYGPALEAAGYCKAKDLIAYDLSLARPLPVAARKLAEQAAAVPGVRERAMDMRRFRAEIGTILDIFNDAWSGNWGFVPMTSAEIAYMAANLRPIVRPELVRIVEVEGEPAAMIVALPDLHEAIADLSGRLLPLGWARLLWRLKMRRFEGARVLLMGVRQAYRGGFLGSGLAALLIARLHEAGAARGLREVELSWVLEDNRPVRRLVEAMGGTPSRHYRIYGKDLA